MEDSRKNLPDMIFVTGLRFKNRGWVLKNVIVGAEETPYHDCRFSYDVCFPKTYPHDPPVRFIISFPTVSYGLILLGNKGC
ncbi:putative ubiquitin-conjugating enzyme E2, ubiquitin-conjugating enzyme/RWD [Helianthus anomalus]